MPQGADLIVEDDDGMLRKYVPQKNSAINNLPVVYEEGSYPSGSPPDGAIDMSSAGGSASQMPSLIGDDAPDSPTSELPNSSAGRSLNNLGGGYPSGGGGGCSGDGTAHRLANEHRTTIITDLGRHLDLLLDPPAVVLAAANAHSGPLQREGETGAGHLDVAACGTACGTEAARLLRPCTDSRPPYYYYYY